MRSTFRRKFNTLGFNSPRWQNVHNSIFNPAKWSRFRIQHFHNLIERFKKSPTKDQGEGSQD